jgi:hypothetical protein
MMYEMHIAKLFKNGTGQTVRLPAEFSFDGDEVYISRDEATGDVVLSSRLGAKIWGEFFDLRTIAVTTSGSRFHWCRTIGLSKRPYPFGQG